MTDIAKPDLCVIGGGHLGLAVARRAAERGVSVVVVEPGQLGGAGRLTDAVPITALSAAGKRAHLLYHAGDFGMSAGEIRIGMRALHNRIALLVADMQRDDNAERCAALGITVLPVAGSFTDRRTFTAGAMAIKAKAFVVAIDAEPRIPDVPGLAGVPYFTSRSIAENTRKLSHLLVIGAGATGLSLAQAYRRLGSEVTVIDSGKALHDHDPEFVAILMAQLRAEGIDIREETPVTAIQKRGQGIGVTLAGRKGEAKLDISHILVAAGSVADVTALAIGRAGPRQRQQGQLAVGPDFRTSNRAIFAVGPAAGLPDDSGIALTADIVVDNAMGGRRRLPPDLLPRLVATDPAIIEIGLSEPMARARLKQNYRIVRGNFAELDGARAAGIAGGVRLILDKGDVIVGAGMAGPEVDELAGLFALAIGNKLTIAQLQGFAPPAGSLAGIAPLLAQRAGEGRPGKTKDGIRRWLPLPGRIL